MKTKLTLKSAQEIADYYLEELAPHCERIEIAGSIRRKKDYVGDIEMVAIPKFETWGSELFGEPLLFNCLEKVINEAHKNGLVLIKNGSRYKQMILPNNNSKETCYPGDILLDLFIVLPPAQWGVLFLIRTGPAEFSRKAVTQKNIGGYLPSDCIVKDGQVLRNGVLIPMSEEDDFLELLGMPGLKPEERADHG